MARPRENVFIWTSLIKSLLAGDTSCHWAAWYPANYTDYLKAPSNFDLTEWKINHSNLLDKLEQEFRQIYSIVQCEWQIEFVIRGKTGAQFKGVPDLVGIGDRLVMICDAKTGQKSDKDWVQLLLYMYYFPKAFPDFCSAKEIRGRIVYLKEPVQEVYYDEISDGFKERLTGLFDMLKSPTPPAKTPSAHDCKFCDIAKEEYPERIEKVLESKQLELEDF